MLIYRIIQLVFIASIAGVFLLGRFSGLSLYYLFLPIVFYIAAIAYGSCNIDSGFFVKAVCKADTKDKIISLTFDDGPDPARTPALLSVLEKHRVKAAFFVIGHKIKGNEELLKNIAEQGHLIGNHTYSHSFWIDMKPPSFISRELKMTDDEIYRVTKIKNRFFRPPYGVTNPFIAKALVGTNYAVVGWNVRSLDTVIKDDSKLLERVLSKVEPGSVILFHDTREGIAEVVDQLITRLHSQGYKIIGLEEMIGKK